MNLSDDELKKIIKKSDLDGDGVFTLKEFKVAFSKEGFKNILEQ